MLSLEELKVVEIKAYITECERLQYDRGESDYTKRCAKLSAYEWIKDRLFSDEELNKIKEEEEAKW